MDLKNRPNFSIFNEFLKKDCSISNPYYISAENVTMRSTISGSDRKKIFEKLYFNINNKSLVTHGYTIDKTYLEKTDELWENFYLLYSEIKKDKNELIGDGDLNGIDHLRKRLLEWSSAYQYIEGTGKYTPYVHILKMHVPEMIERFDNLNKFNTEGLEKVLKYFNKHIFIFYFFQFFLQR